ncbi:MAG: DUF2442 domain-containing protein [Nitrospira sp.]|nr:DUF2442 domain-containing protein [Nitrospira sp.]
MKSAALGKNTSGAEVTNISKHGFWLLVADEELFVPFKEFPWFQDASVSEITNVEWPNPNHLYWPDLDVDLATESIRHPEKFPLISKTPGPATHARRRKKAK